MSCLPIIMAMNSKLHLHHAAWALILGLLTAAGVAAEGTSGAATSRGPVGQVDVALVGELDSRLLQELELEGLAFTSYPPSGLVLVVR